MASADDKGSFDNFISSYNANAPASGSYYANSASGNGSFRPPTGASPKNSIGAGAASFPVKPREKSVLDIIAEDAFSHKKTVAAAAILLIFASGFFFYSSIKALFLLSAFVAIGAVSRMWQRFFPLSFGVELVMLFTVLSAAIYGPLAGLLVGFFALSISTLITQEDIAKMWPSFIAIAAVGYIAGSASVANIAMWGLGLTVLYDAIISVVYVYMGHSIIKTLIFDATHIAFNYFVFFNLAPNLAGLLV